MLLCKYVVDKSLQQALTNRYFCVLSEQVDNTKLPVPCEEMACKVTILVSVMYVKFQKFLNLRGEKLNYNNCASLLLRKSQNLFFFWLLKSSGHQRLPCLFDSRFL